MISYEKLFRLLEKNNITTYILLHEWGIGSSTMKRLKEGKSISTNTIDKFCTHLNCRWEDVAEHIPPKEPEPEPLEPMSEVPRNFIARYNWLMKRAKMRQADVMRATGFSRQLLSAWNLGKTKPEKANREILANLFDVDVDWLMGKK